MGNMRRNITGPIQEEEKVPIVYLPAKSKGYETGRDCATPVRYRDLKKTANHHVHDRLSMVESNRRP